jgi:hypothetical protein
MCVWCQFRSGFVISSSAFCGGQEAKCEILVGRQLACLSYTGVVFMGQCYLVVPYRIWKFNFRRSSGHCHSGITRVAAPAAFYIRLVSRRPLTPTKTPETEDKRNSGVSHKLCLIICRWKWSSNGACWFLRLSNALVCRSS